MIEFVQKVRKACGQRNWSQAVKLVRDEAVIGESFDADEVVVRIHVPGMAVSPTVVLYPEDGEWDCDCGSKELACAHVAAAAIAVSQARKQGSELPTSSVASRHIAYRLRVEDGGLALDRVAILADDSEYKLTTTLSALVSGRVEGGPPVTPNQADLAVDRILGNRPRGRQPTDRAAAVLNALSGSPHVTLRLPERDGRLVDRPVQTSGEAIKPRAALVSDRDGVTLELTADPRITAVVCAGFAMCGDLLQPLAETYLTGRQLENLPSRTYYGPDRIGSLATDILPELRRRIEVDKRTDRVPGVTTAAKPRAIIDVEHAGNSMVVFPRIVYGDPPLARLDGDKLVYLQGDVPIRNKGAEQRVVRHLREHLDLAPGRKTTFTGPDAIRMAERLQSFSGGELIGNPEKKFFYDEALVPRVVTDDDIFDLRFESPDGDTENGEPRRADAEAVLRAWREGRDMVALDGGGWAPLPTGWLEQHGHRVADLLAARQDDGSVARAALPALAALADDLNQPRPAGFDKLAPLIEGFERLPAAELPADLEADLRGYQLEGVNWLAFLHQAGLGGVLADDMGLGKTVQALCGMRGKTLVVCPTSVLPNWAAEAQRFRPGLTVNTYHGPKRELDPDADLTLTTYALLRIDRDKLAAVGWDTMILDEAQAIKNPDSQVARAAYTVDAPFRLSLSGTPVENRLDELWSQLHFTNPGLLGGRRSFDERYARPIARGEEGAVERLRERIRPFVLRRLKQNVAPELPPRTEALLHCELDDGERTVYDAVRAAAQKDVVQQLAAGGNPLAALEALLRLRQAACHRALVPGQEADHSSKIRVLVEALEQISAEDHKALVFSQWTSLLDLIEPHLEKSGITFTRLDGSTRDRSKVVNEFQDENGPSVMLLSLKAGGTGLNLTAADHVFICDPWWNPAVEDQAADRAHRIGQDRPVLVYRLVARDTVEERILALQSRKRDLADSALGGAAGATSITRDDLLALLS